MTANQSKPFFDLAEAVQLSRKLSSAVSRERHATKPDRSSLEKGSSSQTSDVGIREPNLETVDNAMTLWQLLLEWARRVTAADGAFALDNRGFLITAVGTLDPFPPEVFSEAFAAATRLFDTYLSANQAISSVSLTFETIGRVEIVPLQVGAMPVLLGISASGTVRLAELSRVCRTIAAEVSIFDQRTDAVSGERENSRDVEVRS